MLIQNKHHANHIDFLVLMQYLNYANELNHLKHNVPMILDHEPVQKEKLDKIYAIDH